MLEKLELFISLDWDLVRGLAAPISLYFPYNAYAEAKLEINASRQKCVLEQVHPADYSIGSHVGSDVGVHRDLYRNMSSRYRKYRLAKVRWLMWYRMQLNSL